MVGRRFVVGLVPVLVAMVAGAGAASAQSPEPSGGDWCVLAADEVTTLAGLPSPVTAEPSDDACRWSGGEGALRLGRVDYDLSFARTLHPNDGQDVTVAEHPGWFGWSGGEARDLSVDLGSDVVLIELTPATEGAATVDRLVAIGEAAVPRVAALLGAGTGGAADVQLQALLALFPTTLGDEPLSVEGQSGPDLVKGLSPDAQAAITSALAAQGRTVEDLAVAIAYTAERGMIAAFRVAGADAAALAQPFLAAIIPPSAEVTTGTATLGGREATTVSAGGGTLYIVPSGDVVWLLGLDEATATQLLATLP